MAVLVALVWCAGCSPADEQDLDIGSRDAAAAAARCDDAGSLLAQIDCYVTLATEEDDPSVCGLSPEGGARYQCFAILAERLVRRDLCDEIPPASPDHLQLKDICISDVAKQTADGRMCDEITTIGLRDSCYAKIGQGSDDKSLCDKIEDPGLRSMCSGEPVMVE